MSAIDIVRLIFSQIDLSTSERILLSSELLLVQDLDLWSHSLTAHVGIVSSQGLHGSIVGMANQPPKET